MRTPGGIMLKVSFPNAFAADVVVCDPLTVHDGAGCTCRTFPAEGSDLDRCISARQPVRRPAELSCPACPTHMAVVNISPGGALNWASSTPPIRRAVTNNLLEAVT